MTDLLEVAVEDTTVVFQLCYASAAAVPFSTDALKTLLAEAREKNARVGVTGILLYHEGSFIQVLEGERAAVETLYEKISQDPRHANTMLLFQTETATRSFPDWTMGFVRRGTDSPPGLNRFFEDKTTDFGLEDADSVRRLLLGFKNGRWRRTVDF